MAYIPQTIGPETHWPPFAGQHAPPTVVVHALKENRKPIGFWPWPEEPKKKRKKKAK
jgi:hypothetical protein